jgi:hypothetical protein
MGTPEAALLKQPLRPLPGGEEALDHADVLLVDNMPLDFRQAGNKLRCDRKLHDLLRITEETDSCDAYHRAICW